MSISVSSEQNETGDHDMKTLLNKTTSFISRIALFAIGGAMALIGFATIGIIAFFALLAAFAAMLASPFISTVLKNAEEANEEASTA